MGAFFPEERADEGSDFGSLRPGVRLGRYELLVPVARGGMARVWAARQHGQRGFQKLVAIKTILPHLAGDPEFERMFLDEARIASGVHHPNVCEIYELGEDRQTLYLAMEWVNGDSLSRLLRASGRVDPLDARIVARIVADACAGAHAAHELTEDDGRPLCVVHRDLSPHNVLITSDGVTKVCDFGVAKAKKQLHEETTAGQLKGKISYMAPEQITGSPIDRRTDVFSLGCVLYEATTGVKPFRGEGDHEIMHAILNGEIAAPTSFVRGYPAELERIVLRALAREPALRHPSAEAMRFALEELLTRGPLVTQPSVAQVVRARIGEHLEQRRERIKQAQPEAENAAWEPGKLASMRDGQEHRSGVQAARPSLSSLGCPRPSKLASVSSMTAAPAALDPPSPAHAGAPIAPPSPTSGVRVADPAAETVRYDVTAAMSERAGASTTPAAGQYVLAAFVGLFLALLIAAGGFMLWRSRSAHVAPPPAAPAEGVATSSPSASLLPEFAKNAEKNENDESLAAPKPSASASAKPRPKPRPKDVLPDNPY